MLFVNSKAEKWYLHSKEVVFGKNDYKRINYFFKRVKGEGYCELPSGYVAKETKHGMPVLTRIGKK